MIPSRLMPNRVTLYLGAEQGPFGPIPGEPTTVRALVEGSNRVVRTGDGAEVVSGTRVYLDPVTIEEGSEVTIHPELEIEETHRVLRVSQFRAPGKSHTVLDLE